MDTISLTQVLQICGVMCSFLCSVTAVVLTALKKRDTNKIASYQHQFKKLLDRVLEDGQITDAERKELRYFFIDTALKSGLTSDVLTEVKTDEV